MFSNYINKTYKLFQVDSFAEKLFTGNPAGVVLNADGLTEEGMQMIAREMNNSETAFIFSADDSDHDHIVRFFTPTTEVPSCGHATIAANYILAKEAGLKGRVNQKCKIGIIPISIKPTKDNDYEIYMTQKRPEFSTVREGKDKKVLLTALQIREDDLVSELPIQIVSTGHSKVLVPLAKKQVLDNLKPDMATLYELSRRIGCNGYHVFTLDASEKGILAYSRMFAPAIGINEDPVTGNGNGPMGAYIVYHRMVEPASETFRFRAVQGEMIKRRGEIQVEVQIKNNYPEVVTVGGRACKVFETELEL